MPKRSVSASLAFLLLFSLFAGLPGTTAVAADPAPAGGATQSVSSAVYAANSTSSSITLAWPDEPGAAGYNVYRAAADDGTYTKINAAAVSSARYTDTGLSANTRYYYKVTSFSTGGENAVSAGMSALTQPDFGPSVYVFDPSTPAADIQAISDNVFAKQETNQFGSERYALLFKPGSYNANIRMGFYTHVAGLGQLPDDVTINGGVTVDANWLPPHNATQNFWRSVENFAVAPSSGNMLWAVSQAASMRRMHIKGGLTLHDQGGWASGGYLADSVVDATVVPGSQQQWFSRNSKWASWNGSVWNTTILGSVNPPAENWPTNAYTVIDKTPVVREKPFLTFDASKNQYQVFVPDAAADTNGPSWANGPAAGNSIPIEDFYVANPASSVDSINAALSQGKNLLLTPGVYHIAKPIQVTRPNTVVLGLGLATLHADNGNAALSVADVDGVKVAGLLFEAGAVSSPVLLQVGPQGSVNDHSANPTSLQDLYFRVGGDALAKADVCVEINSNNVIGDHFWVWRADHGKGAGWDSNLTTNGMVVNGNDVTFYGLFVEHFHQYQTVWNGERGRMYFYQTEMPYDVPNQASWMSRDGTVNGYSSYKVADSVTSHEAYGLGLYSFFRDADVKQDHAIEVPDVPGVKIHHATTVFLSGMGEITHIVNGTGNTVKKGSIRATLADFKGYNIRTSSIALTSAGNATAIAVKGGTLQFSAAVTPDNAEEKSVVWSVVNEDGTATDKATINANGLLTAGKDGVVKVIATAFDRSGAAASMTINIFGQNAALKKNWGWVREGAANWAVDPANANVIKMMTQEGTWNPASNNFPKGILLTDPGTTGDFTITTKLKFAALNNYEFAGLVVYQDDGHLISLGRSSANQIRFSRVLPNNAQTDKNYTDPTVPGEVYLKIDRTGTVYSGYYSPDGITWTKAADTFNLSLTNAKVGIFTRKLGPAAKVAQFTNFSLNGTVVPFWNPVTSVTVWGEGGTSGITAKGGTLQMAAEVLPADVDNKSVLWSVVNADGTAADKAAISADGLLTAVKNGQVKVTATALDGSGVTGSATIGISGQLPVTGVALDKHSLALTAGGSAQVLTAAVTPDNAENKALRWTSSDETVATVDASGSVTPLKAGNATVTVTTEDGGFHDACAVIVLPHTALTGAESTMSGTPFDLAYSLGSTADSVSGNVVSQDVTFTYDPALVDFVSADVLKDGFTIADQQTKPGQVRIRLAAAAGNDGTPVNLAGDWLTLHWKAKPLTQTTAAAISLSQAALTFGDGTAAQLAGASHNVQIVYADRSALNAVMVKAQQAYDGAKEGHAVGTYPQGSKAALLAAIQKAQAIRDNVSAAQNQVDQGTNDLGAALKTFQDSLKTDNGRHNGNDKGDNHNG